VGIHGHGRCEREATDDGERGIGSGGGAAGAEEAGGRGRIGSGKGKIFYGTWVLYNIVGHALRLTRGHSTYPKASYPAIQIGNQIYYIHVVDGEQGPTVLSRTRVL
jgi:hypothetical protein